MSVLGKKMCSGRRHPWKEISPARRHHWEGVIHRELSLGRRWLWEDSISWKETSPTRMSLGRCHPQGGVSGKVSGRGCPREDVILRKEMCLRRCLQEDTVLGKKMFPRSRHIWEDVPRKETSLGRCHLLEGDIPVMDIPGQVSSTGMRHQEEDIPGKMTSLRKETSPFKQPKCMEAQQGETGDTVILGEQGGTQEDTGTPCPREAAFAITRLSLTRC